jgi:hypothetical protein
MFEPTVAGQFIGINRERNASFTFKVFVNLGVGNELGGEPERLFTISGILVRTPIMVKRFSGMSNWQEGLNVLVECDSIRRTIKTAYDFLSGRGTHGQEIPTREETQAGLEQTLAEVRFVLAGGKGQPRG